MSGARPAVWRERRVWRFVFSRLLRFLILPLKLLFGFDVFISYARRDMAAYAQALSVQAGRLGLRPRIDQQESRAGARIPMSLRIAIIFSRVLVVLNSRGAAVSSGVADEILTFTRWSGGPVVPIELDCAMEEAIWWPEIENLSRVVEDPRALAANHPSIKTIRRVRTAVGFWRVTRAQTFAMAIVAALLATLGYLSVLARQGRDRAIQAEGTARKGAEAASGRAAKEELAAQSARQDAIQQGQIAEERRQSAERYLAEADARSMTSDALVRARETQTYSIGPDALYAIAAARRSMLPEAIDGVREISRLLPVGIKQIEHRGDAVLRTTYSAGGHWLATLAGSHVRVFDVRGDANAEEQGRCCDIPGAHSIQWHPVDENVLAVAGRTAGLCHVDKAECTPLGTHTYASTMDTRIRFSPKGRYVAVFNDEIYEPGGVVSILDGATGKELHPIPRPTPNAAAFDRQERIVAIGSAPGCVQLYDLPDATRRGECLPGEGKIESLQFSPDADVLAIGRQNGTVELYDPATGRLTPLISESSPLTAMRWSPDGTLLAIAAEHHLRVIDRAGQSTAFQQHIPGKFSFSVNAIAFSPDSRLVASGGDDALVHVLEARTGRETQRYSIGSGAEDVEFSPDGKQLAIGHDAWRAELMTLPPETFTQWLGAIAKEARMRLSAGGERLLLAKESVQLRKTATGESIAPLGTLGVEAEGGVDFDPASSMLAVGNDEQTNLFPTDGSKKIVLQNPWGSGRVESVTFGSSGLIAVATQSGAGVGNLPWTGKWRWRTQQPTTAIALDPSGEKVALGTNGGSLFVVHWKQDRDPDRMPRGVPIIDFLDHPVFELTHKSFKTGVAGDTIRAISFSGDGRYVVCGGDAGWAVVFDVVTGSKVAAMKLAAPIRAIAFGSKDREVIAIDSDHQQSRFLWRPSDVLNDACGRFDPYSGQALREVTPREWERDLGLHLTDNPCRETAAK